MSVPCRTTQHCAYHGWCHRCDPQLAEAGTLVVRAMKAAGITEEWTANLYRQVMGEFAAAKDPNRCSACGQRIGHFPTCPAPRARLST